MLNNCKISQYKIKKILKCFTQDLTAVETSKAIDLNRKTVNRYYNIFRKILLDIQINVIKTDCESLQHIGWIKGEYGEKNYLNIYKKNKNTFFCITATEKCRKYKPATNDQDFEQYLNFIHKRFTKFHGFNKKTYHYQLFESIIKYQHSEQYIFDSIYKSLKSKSKQYYPYR